MKKTLVSALTTALVVGAASTTFAAANPFADVPADHWAYDAVAQLVQDGVVNGYSADGSFKGDQSMSRYEMAQIVAKAMAKSDAADNNNKALIEKLSAEFSDELANLGVRVANLEAKTDNVKWTGLIRYDWNNTNYEGANSGHRDHGDNQLKLRFTPSITINDNWTGYSEIDYNYNYNWDENRNIGLDDNTGEKYVSTTATVQNVADVNDGEDREFTIQCEEPLV
ncbi:MAG: S-layer homology domain-containing protein [Selenomonadaceae bacterium]|nr:S-layer homology domain-containing protein [Selenomonadaceae bacterium]